MEIISTIESGNFKLLSRQLIADPSLATNTHKSGISALMLALYYKREDMAKVISDYCESYNLGEMIALDKQSAVEEHITHPSFNIEQYSPDGFLPIHYAAFFARPKLLNLFITKGANINKTTNNESEVSPIHSAVAGSDYTCVKLLCDAKADINAKQHGGWTALMAASKAGRMDMVDELLSHGATIHITADNGLTALDLAESAGNTKVLQRLEAHINPKGRV